MMETPGAENIHMMYARRAAGHRQRCAQCRKQIKWLGLLRLIFFALAAWQCWVFIRNAFTGAGIWYGLSALIVFAGLLLLSLRYQRQLRYHEQMAAINANEASLFEGGRSFLDAGDHARGIAGFATDLNIFGAGSLYHILNRTGTVSGRQQLTGELLSPFTEAASIRNRQQAVAELAPLIDFRQELLARGLLIGKEDGLDRLKAGIDFADYAVLDSKGTRWLARLWPVITGGLIVYSVSINQYRLLLLFLVLGLIVSALFVRFTGALYFHVSRRSSLYTSYAACFQVLSDTVFQHSYLLEQQRSVRDAQKAFGDLSKLGSWFDARLNILISPIINGLFLADIQCARAYLRWSRNHQQRVPEWFATLGRMELLNSIATFHYNHPSFVFPEPVTEGLELSASAVGHPLMNESKAVVNDVTLGTEGRLHLVTGSNMSGKSTYLRTVGLNLLLARMGAPVFAAAFRFTPMQLLTSFHHIDSLEESTSYFYAELKSLQQIIHALSNQTPSLVLLDEVMRGTNSKDKHDGTALLIEKLLAQRCLAMIATHDTELGVLADIHAGEIRNFCFESRLEPEGLHFDFKRRPGVAATTNATYLMKQMGII